MLCFGRVISNRLRILQTEGIDLFALGYRLEFCVGVILLEGSVCRAVMPLYNNLVRVFEQVDLLGLRPFLEHIVFSYNICSEMI